MRKRILGLAILLSIVLVVPGTAQAQGRSIFWERWDAVFHNIDTTNNRFDVREIYDIRFNGRFQFGSAVIPLTNVESIDNIQVYQAGRAMRQGGCVSEANIASARGTFCVERVQEGISIVYYFEQPITDGSENFEVAYTVNGGLYVYDGGDQLRWEVIPTDKFGFSVGSSNVTVELPDGYAPRADVDIIEAEGLSADIQVQGTTVTFRVTESIEPDERLRIGVQYPHDPNARMAAWQPEYDDDVAYRENVEPLVNLGAIAVSLLVLVVGPLLTYLRWYNKGRDPKVGPVPTYLEEPPGELRPAVVGALVDETADVRDIMSTIIDLARREYLVIEESRKEGMFGLGGSSEFVFKRTDKSNADLKAYERKIIDKVFKGGMERELEDLKHKFYTAIPGLQDDLYEELVNEGLFTAKPSTTRGIYSTIGLVIGGLAFAAGFMIFGALEDGLSEALLCLPAAFGVTGLVIAVAGQYMPAKTQKGALEAAKWNAFEEFLQNIEKYRDVDAATQLFDQYLPYAIAFGMERSWIRRFSKLEATPIPTWYFPTYAGGHYGRGYRAGTPISHNLPSAGDVLPGEIASAGGGGGMSLDTLAGDFSGGLESMASGLSDMLESASRTLTSKPQSSGNSSWGGGGWSGGGSLGGGSIGGGGSRGFG